MFTFEYTYIYIYIYADMYISIYTEDRTRRVRSGSTSSLTSTRPVDRVRGPASPDSVTTAGLLQGKHLRTGGG